MKGEFALIGSLDYVTAGGRSRRKCSFIYQDASVFSRGYKFNSVILEVENGPTLIIPVELFDNLNILIENKGFQSNEHI